MDYLAIAYIAIYRRLHSAQSSLAES